MRHVNPKKLLGPQLVVGLRPSEALGVGNNPKDRYGLAKVPFSLIPPTTNVFLALGLKHGARKYGPYNWRVEAVQGRVYLEAAYRHLLLLLDGEDFDRDTGIHHGAFILSTIAIYMDAMVQGKLIDNRALRGRTGDLVAFFNELPGTEKTQQELIDGFKRLVPNNHFGAPEPAGAITSGKLTSPDGRFVLDMDENMVYVLPNKKRKRPTTKKASRKATKKVVTRARR